eukprot:scaffold3025_cov59-Phaeocystis_antarctica.AAC.4
MPGGDRCLSCLSGLTRGPAVASQLENPPAPPRRLARSVHELCGLDASGFEIASPLSPRELPELGRPSLLCG